jgi:hypothetical protein
VFGLAFLLMLVTFRSIVIPIKAIILNLLSVGAAYGVLVLVFQDGHGESLLGFTSIGGVTNWLPLFLFVVLFGLSMDYHVFILSRVRELYDRGLSTDEAVKQGISTTAGTVTSAAAVMVGVFAVFITLSFLDFKELGLGLAAAVLIDATIIRGVLLPASMKLLGDWTGICPAGWNGCHGSGRSATPPHRSGPRIRPPPRSQKLRRSHNQHRCRRSRLGSYGHRTSDMTAIAPGPFAVSPLRRRRGRRVRVARLERPLLAAGLALVALHLLDLALSGADTTILGVLGIVGIPVAWLLMQPRLSRPTRAELGIAVGLLAVGFGVVSHGLHVVNSGLDWPDVAGVGMIVGGVLLVAAGVSALAAPRRPPRRTGLGWRRSRGGLAPGCRRVLPGRLHAAHDRHADHPRPTLGDPGVLAGHRPRGGPDRDHGRLRAGGVVRPIQEPNGGAAEPRLGRQPRAGGRARADARPARLRRARVRQPRQR